MIPCSTPTTTTTVAVTRGDRELALADAPDRGHPAVVDQPQADQEHDGREDGVGHVGQGTGQEQQHGDHDRARGELRDLAAPAPAVDHLGLRGAAVHDEGAADAGPDVRHAEADEVDVLVEAVAVLHGVGPRRGRALGEDHDDQGDHRGQQRHDVRRGHDLGGQAERRQAARHRPEDRDAHRLEVEEVAGGDRADDGDERARDRLVDAPQDQDHREDGDGDHERGTFVSVGMSWSVSTNFWIVPPLTS